MIKSAFERWKENKDPLAGCEIRTKHVSIENIKTLRKETGCAISDCKKSLQITDDNIEAAKTLLNVIVKSCWA